MWLCKVVTWNYYFWVIAVVVFYPMAVILDALLCLWSGLVDGAKDFIADFDPPAYTREQFKRLRRRYWRTS